MAAKRVNVKLGPSRGHVEVDGRRLHGVSGVHVSHTVGDIPRIMVDLVTLDSLLDVEQADVEIPEKVQEALVALGWTPPDGA